MWQIGIAMRSLPGSLSGAPKMQELPRRMPKVHLVLVLNQDTLNHPDAYVTMHGGNEMAHLETIQDGLHWVAYV